MATRANVRPNVWRLTDADARHLLADGIIRTCALTGPNGAALGPSRVGLEIGCDEKTVRRARDEESTLGIACAFNLLDVNERALDTIANAKGFAIVRLASTDGPDIVMASGAVLHKVGQARSADSPGGTDVTDEEMDAMEADVALLEEAAASLHARIAAIKLRRAT